MQRDYKIGVFVGKPPSQARNLDVTRFYNLHITKNRLKDQAIAAIYV